MTWQKTDKPDKNFFDSLRHSSSVDSFFLCALNIQQEHRIQHLQYLCLINVPGFQIADYIKHLLLKAMSIIIRQSDFRFMEAYNRHIGDVDKVVHRRQLNCHVLIGKQTNRTVIIGYRQNDDFQPGRIYIEVVGAQCDFLPAVGDGEPWDLISYKVKAKAALPIIDILTLAATGSEYDCGGVISRTETNDKIGYIDPLLFPVCSFLDPRYTFSVSKKQTADGCADAMNHTIEQYFAADTTLLNDGFCESMLKSLMVNARKCLENPEGYTARAEMMFACTLGCNGILSLGNSPSGWPCHGIEHALSAYYNITHGEGLAIITPRWMRHIFSERTIDRFVKYGVNVFGIDASLPKKEIAEKAIDATYAFFESINIPMHLRDVGIGEERIDEMAHHIAVNEGLERAYVPLTERDIKEILIASL